MISRSIPGNPPLRINVATRGSIASIGNIREDHKGTRQEWGAKRKRKREKEIKKKKRIEKEPITGWFEDRRWCQTRGAIAICMSAILQTWLLSSRGRRPKVAAVCSVAARVKARAPAYLDRDSCDAARACQHRTSDASPGSVLSQSLKKGAHQNT